MRFVVGSITHSLNSEIPENAVSDRANVSKVVLEQHYDRRTKRKRWSNGGNTWIIYSKAALLALSS